MQIVFDLINPSTVTDDEIKATITAVLCHEILLGRQIPGVIHLRLVKNTIRRDNHHRTGELKYVVGDTDRHKIRIAYGGRKREDVLMSIFHEMVHLTRVYNGENSKDYDQEELENKAQMVKLSNLVEWVSSVLVVYIDGGLGRLHAEEAQS